MSTDIEEGTISRELVFTKLFRGDLSERDGFVHLRSTLPSRSSVEEDVISPLVQCTDLFSFSSDENSFPAYSLAQNFYFSQKLDIIEEDALNEKCCVQVLEILIAKADTEIAELEDDIVMLQSQLARTDEKWLDMCIAALNKKIDRLGSLITALKNENVQTSGVDLQTNRKPSERIHDILETLLRNFSSPRDKQLHKAIYGLKQAPRAWCEELKSYLISYGFCHSVRCSSYSLTFWNFLKPIEVYL